MKSAAVAAAILAAGHGAPLAQEVSGKLTFGGRFVPHQTQDPRQKSTFGELSFEPEFYFSMDNGSSFTLVPVARLDSGDRQRRLFDIREAAYLDYGELGNSEWELRVGIDRVHWGVAESQNIVDIVNQRDLSFHPDGKFKLGQPMAYLTLSGDWGSAELLALIGHRARRFPGPEGRLRGAVIAPGKPSYENPRGRNHIDFAARFSRSFDSLDVGLSLFRGTSREPSLIPSATSPCPLPDDPSTLQPCYELISQIGIDAQWAIDEWLLKLEAIRRSGMRDLSGAESNYTAAILGVERTIFSIADSPADVTVFAEWLWDGRRELATNIYNGDAFLAARLAANDPMGTEVTGSVLADTRSRSRLYGLELSRRVSDNLLVRAEASYISASDDPLDDPLIFGIRDDSFFALKFEYGF